MSCSTPTPIRIIELRAGEGGADARAFAAEMAHIYRRLAERRR